MASKYEIGAPYGAAEGSLTSSLGISLISALSSPLALVRRVTADVVQHRAFRKAEKELHALDDRMLKDIGIDRSEIHSALTSAAQQRRSHWRT